ncbi:MAG TPA: acetyl-CoA carboxylase carboxyl transferase subunit beta, partial [Oceanospirillales bacterium]|nr:acetyl-CoA carboxylase carboxyl transferase subunit beta [Oceanospirillales bacterium]
MSWFQKIKLSRIRTEGGKKKSIPEGLWTKCEKCDETLWQPELEKAGNVCPKCSYHGRLTGRKRLEYFLDKDSTQEIAKNLESLDPLKFKDSKKYKDRTIAAQKKTGEKD